MTKDKCYCGKPLSEHYDADGEFGECLDGELRFDPLACPGCSGKVFTETSVTDVVVCERCCGIISRPGTVISDHVSYDFVRPKMKGVDDDTMGRSRYFDFTIQRGSGAVDRRHGWYDPEDGLITQCG